MKTLVALMFAIAISIMPAMAAPLEFNKPHTKYCEDIGNAAYITMDLRQRGTEYFAAVTQLLKVFKLQELNGILKYMLYDAYTHPVFDEYANRDFKEKLLIEFHNKYVAGCMNSE